MEDKKIRLVVSDAPVSQQDKDQLKAKAEATKRQANRESKVDPRVLQIQFNV
jgi:hypothetical protein